MNSIHLHGFKTLSGRCRVKSQSLQVMLLVEWHPKSNVLQKHPTKLSVWAKKWWVSLSESNCKIIHAGENSL